MLGLLADRNRGFVDHSLSGPLELRPVLRTTVIGCLDPCVDPAIVLGLELGDAPVIRNIGGRITPAVLHTLDLLALGFATQTAAAEADKGDLIVLQHNQCGIMRMQADPGALAANFGVDPAELPGKAVGDPRAALAVDVDLLNTYPGISDSQRAALRHRHRPGRDRRARGGDGVKERLAGAGRGGPVRLGNPVEAIVRRDTAVAGESVPSLPAMTPSASIAAMSPQKTSLVATSVNGYVAQVLAVTPGS